MKPFVPADKVLVAASSLSGNFSYAGVAQVNDGETRLSVYEGKRMPSIAARGLRRYKKVSFIQATSAGAAEPQRVDDLGRAVKYLQSINRKEKTYESESYSSDGRPDWDSSEYFGRL